jgi:RNA recognition motif-containing protein
MLIRAFSKYASFQKAKVVRDKFTCKCKGFGFLSFSDPFDMVKCLREMNGKNVREDVYVYVVRKTNI